jgi:hypothetical protein
MDKEQDGGAGNSVVAVVDPSTSSRTRPVPRTRRHATLGRTVTVTPAGAATYD